LETLKAIVNHPGDVWHWPSSLPSILSDTWLMNWIIQYLQLVNDPGTSLFLVPS
jgi:hypothetical protein